MWMRVVRSHGLTDAKAREMLDNYHEAGLPLMDRLPGVMGFLAGENRTGGSVAVVSFWESEQAMNDSEAESREVRERTQKEFTRSDSMLVERFEVPFTTHLARAVESPQMLRLIRFNELSREQIDAAAKRYLHVLQTERENVPGLSGFVFARAYDAGVCGTLTLWSTDARLRQSEQLSQKTRDDATPAAQPQEADPLEGRWPLMDRYEIRFSSKLERLATVEDVLAKAPSREG